MGKSTHQSIYDAALDQCENSEQLSVCSAEPTTVYEGADAPAWQASQAYSLGEAVRPSTRNGYCYECTTAGTSAGSEPTWPTSPGATVNDGSVEWTARTNYSLAAGAINAGEYTKAAGDVSGRKTTLAAQSGLSIHTTGTADHVATLNLTEQRLGDVTTTPSQGLTEGGTVDVSAFKHEIQAPT